MSNKRITSRKYHIQAQVFTECLKGYYNTYREACRCHLGVEPSTSALWSCDSTKQIL